MSRARRSLVFLSATAVAVTLAACSPGTSDASGASAGGSTGAGDPAVSAVRAAVQKAMQARDSISVPTEKLTGKLSTLSGKTVYYVPLTAQISVFQLYGKKLGEALGKANVKLQICDGGANPSQISGCIDQAVGASAAAIVTDNVPYGMAANSLDAARAKNIPVIITNQIVDPQHPADTSLAYVTGPATDMVTSVAQWVIADSGGKATVVLQKVTDNPSTVAWAQDIQKEFADRCPACKVEVNEVSAANFPLVPSSTSSAILRNPDTGYVVAEFEHFSQPTIAGIQQSGKTGIKLVSSAATLSGVQMVQKGTLSADAGQDFAYQGWATADAVFRLALGQQVPQYDVPFRLFTKDNVGSVKLTADAEASGEWYAPGDFQQKFAALWGLS